MGIVVFTPFVFIDSADVVFMILNGGNWSPVFNPLTRTVYVLWSTVLLATGIHVIHGLRLSKSVVISVICNVLSVFINVIFVR